MTDATRRGFLGTLLSTAGLAAAACGQSPQQSAAPAPPPATPVSGGPTPPVPIDLKVASHFCGHTSMFGVKADVPFFAVDLYGLVCADGKNSELLLPNSHHALLGGSHLHRARLYSTASVTAGAPDGIEKRLDTNEALPYWALEGYQLTFTPVDGGAKPLPSPGAHLTMTNRAAQPWAAVKNIMNVCASTGQMLLPLNARADAKLVAARIDLKDGSLEAGVPFTPLGCFSEWTVKTSAGDDVVSAITDNMIFVRALPAGTVGLQITFTPIDGSVAAKKPAVLALKDGRLTAAITHASPAPMSANPKPKLEDSRAFALLLEKGNPSAFPVPAFARGAHGEPVADFTAFAKLSGDDGHCNCALCI